jgi:glycosyltransferase involved in cell wall biosynthesis
VAPRVLYISYDGVTEPLARSQVLAPVKALADAGTRVTLLTFEKREYDGERAAVARELAGRSVRWLPRRYHKRPSALATLGDVAVGVASALMAWPRERFSIVHARSYVAALIAVALRRLLGLRFLFDIRGFWVDERVEGRIWPGKGRLYRVAKACERRFFLAADEIVTLTRASVPLIESLPYLRGRYPRITVIPTCADLTRFRPGPARPATPVTFLFAGSFGSWYMPDEMLDCFAVARRRFPGARFTVLTTTATSAVRARVTALGLDADVVIGRAGHDEMPARIHEATVGLFFIQPVWSKQASNPTKLAEFLGCGVPVVINAGIGDTEAIVTGERVGVVAKRFGADEYERIMDELADLLADPELGRRCRAAAERSFALDDAVTRYREIYERLEAGR